MPAEFPQTDPWFAALAPERRRALLDLARTHQAATGARVYGIGDPPDGLWAVAQGEVRLISYPAVGVEAVSMIVGPGGWFGELSVVDGGPRPHDAVVARPTRLLHVALAAVERLAADTPLLYRDLGVLIATRQRSAISFMGHSIAQPIAVRLARSLAGAARSAGAAELAVRQEDLAAMIGVSRQTINKELKALEAAGAVERAYGRIRILDAERLRAVGRSA